MLYRLHCLLDINLSKKNDILRLSGDYFISSIVRLTLYIACIGLMIINFKFILKKISYQNIVLLFANRHIPIRYDTYHPCTFTKQSEKQCQREFHCLRQ